MEDWKSWEDSKDWRNLEESEHIDQDIGGSRGSPGELFAIFEAWSGTFGFLGGFCRIPGASWRALTTFLRVCQEDLGAWGQLSDDPWEYLGMILAVWVMKKAVSLRQDGTKERLDRQTVVGLAKHRKTIVFS